MNKRVFIAVVCCFPLGTSAGAAELTGTVKDLVADVGIPGVRIEILNPDSKKVGEGVTNSKGLYRVQALPLGNLKVFYRKEAYVDRPDVRQVLLKEAGVELDVYMMKENRDEAYLKRALDALLKLESTRPEMLIELDFATELREGRFKHGEGGLEPHVLEIEKVKQEVVNPAGG